MTENQNIVETILSPKLVMDEIRRLDEILLEL